MFLVGDMFNVNGCELYLAGADDMDSRQMDSIRGG